MRAQLRFRRGLERLSSQGIRSFIVHGNHDPVQEGWSAVREWPDGVTVFGHDTVEEEVVEWEGQPVATVHGISFGHREETENLALRFRRGDGPGVHVGVLHANVGGNPDHDPYAPCSLTDLVEGGMDYWALGHIHLRQVVRPGDPWIVYPGDLQGRSPKPSELDSKGALVVEVEGRAIAEPEFVPVDVVRFEQLDVDVSELTIPRLQDELAAQGDRMLRNADGRSLIVRCRLTGQGSIHGDLARRGTVEDLLQTLRDEFSDREPFLWWESVRNNTVGENPIDVEAVRARDDFAGVLVAVADQIWETREELEDLVEQAFHPLPTGPLARLDVETEDMPDEDLWNEAVMLALELLIGGES